MMYGLYLSTAGLQAEDYRQSVFANNLANSQTVGFKRDLAMIMSRQAAPYEDPAMAGYRVPVLSQQGGGVLAMPSRMDMTQGTLQSSSNKLDLALQGPGFFLVQGPDGKPALTRDGRFLINKDQQLTMQNGTKVLDDGGSPITLNPNIDITIQPDGQILQDGAKVAQLGIRNVSDSSMLQKLGGNLITARPGIDLQTTHTDAIVKQGATEASGTDPIVEMVNMMEGQRVFEANAKMITYQDTILQEVNMMGRLA